MLILLTDNFIFCITEYYTKNHCVDFLAHFVSRAICFLFLYLNSSCFLSRKVFNALSQQLYIQALSHNLQKYTYQYVGYYLKKLTTEQIQFKTTQKNNYYGQWRHARVQISQLLPMCCVHGYRASNVLGTTGMPYFYFQSRLLLLVDCVCLKQLRRPLDTSVLPAKQKATF